MKLKNKSVRVYVHHLERTIKAAARNIELYQDGIAQRDRQIAAIEGEMHDDYANMAQRRNDLFNLLTETQDALHEWTARFGCKHSLVIHQADLLRRVAQQLDPQIGNTHG